MDELEKFPDELGEDLKQLWEIVTELKETDSEFRRLTATLHIINFYSCVPIQPPCIFGL